MTSRTSFATKAPSFLTMSPPVAASPSGAPHEGYGHGTTEHSSLHALPQLHERLVEGTESDQPRARELQVENDIHRQRHDGREAQHVEPSARLCVALVSSAWAAAMSGSLRYASSRASTYCRKRSRSSG